jgi:hypothetical protein
MLDVDIKNSDRHAEVPLRAVQLDRSRKLVIVDSGEVDGFVPPTRRERLGADERDRLRETYRDTKQRQVRYNLRDRDTRDDDRAAVDEEGTIQETVVDRKPVVMEEVVVRRRTVDSTDDDLDLDDRDRKP